MHADAEIATALSDGLDSIAPKPGAMASLVRGHGDPQAPAPVLSQSAKQQPDHDPLEADGGNIADLSCKPAFAGPEARCSCKQDQLAPHQP
jgi:hypothetical protein